MIPSTPREELLAKIARRIPDSPDVVEAMGDVPREIFLTPDLQSQAYRDMPLPIGNGQTISQPSLVALMTAKLELHPEARVLEIGTGCGYQTAILAALAKEVFTIEVRGDLSAGAREKLKALRLTNVHFRVGDGMLGWKEAAPFDAIIVTAAAEEVPQILLDQLVTGGRMIIPVNTETDDHQELFLVKKTADGPELQSLLPVRFVPIISKDPGIESG